MRRNYIENKIFPPSHHFQLWHQYRLVDFRAFEPTVITEKFKANPFIKEISNFSLYK